jgi:hypothetical protein
METSADPQLWYLPMFFMLTCLPFIPATMKWEERGRLRLGSGLEAPAGSEGTGQGAGVGIGRGEQVGLKGSVADP